MKAKTLGKKFTLNKRTIAHLNDREMVDVNGGAGGILVSIPPTCICTETCSCVLSVCDTCM